MYHDESIIHFHQNPVTLRTAKSIVFMQYSRNADPFSGSLLISAHCSTIQRKSQRFTLREFSGILDDFVREFQSDKFLSVSHLPTLNKIVEILNYYLPQSLLSCGSHQFFTIVRNAVQYLLNQFILYTNLTNPDIYILRNLLILLENLIHRTDTIESISTWISETNFLQIVGKSLVQMKKVRKNERNQQIVKQINRLIGLFSYIQEHSPESLQQGLFQPLFQPAMACLTSSNYLKLFRSLPSDAESLTNAEKFFLVKCPRFLTTYSGPPIERGFEQILEIMLPRYLTILDQHMKTVDNWTRSTMRAIHNLLITVISAEEYFAFYAHDPVLRLFIDHLIKIIGQPVLQQNILTDANSIQSLLIDTTLLLINIFINENDILDYIKQRQPGNVLRKLILAPRESIVFNSYYILSFTTEENDIDTSPEEYKQILANIIHLFHSTVIKFDDSKTQQHVNSDEFYRKSIKLIESIQNLTQYEQLIEEFIRIGALSILVNANEKLQGKSKEILLHCIWSLVFRDPIANDIRENHSFMVSLENLMKEKEKEKEKGEAETSEQNTSNKTDDHIDSSTVTLSKVIDGILWTLSTDRFKKRRRRYLKKNRKRFHYDAMLCCSHFDYEIVKKINEYLTGNGFRVWFNDQFDKETELETIIEAVDTSRCILICISDSFKRNNFCHAAVEHALLQDRVLLPIIVRKSGKLDSWLSPLRNVKEIINLTHAEARPALKELSKEIAIQLSKQKTSSRSDASKSTTDPEDINSSSIIDLVRENSTNIDDQSPEQTSAELSSISQSITQSSNVSNVKAQHLQDKQNPIKTEKSKHNAHVESSTNKSDASIGEPHSIGELSTSIASTSNDNSFIIIHDAVTGHPKFQERNKEASSTTIDSSLHPSEHNQPNRTFQVSFASVRQKIEKALNLKPKQGKTDVYIKQKLSKQPSDIQTAVSLMPIHIYTETNTNKVVSIVDPVSRANFTLTKLDEQTENQLFSRIRTNSTTSVVSTKSNDIDSFSKLNQSSQPSQSTSDTTTDTKTNLRNQVENDLLIKSTPIKTDDQNTAVLYSKQETFQSSSDVNQTKSNPNGAALINKNTNVNKQTTVEHVEKHLSKPQVGNSSSNNQNKQDPCTSTKVEEKNSDTSNEKLSNNRLFVDPLLKTLPTITNSSMNFIQQTQLLPQSVPKLLPYDKMKTFPGFLTATSRNPIPSFSTNTSAGLPKISKLDEGQDFSLITVSNSSTESLKDRTSSSESTQMQSSTSADISNPYSGKDIELPNSRLVQSMSDLSKTAQIQFSSSNNISSNVTHSFGPSIPRSVSSTLLEQPNKFSNQVSQPGYSNNNLSPCANENYDRRTTTISNPVFTPRTIKLSPSQPLPPPPPPPGQTTRTVVMPSTILRPPPPPPPPRSQYVSSTPSDWRTANIDQTRPQLSMNINNDPQVDPKYLQNRTHIMPPVANQNKFGQYTAPSESQTSLLNTNPVSSVFLPTMPIESRQTNDKFRPTNPIMSNMNSNQRDHGTSIDVSNNTSLINRFPIQIQQTNFIPTHNRNLNFSTLNANSVERSKSGDHPNLSNESKTNLILEKSSSVGAALVRPAVQPVAPTRIYRLDIPEIYRNRNTQRSTYQYLSMDSWNRDDVLDYLFDLNLNLMMPLCELMTGPALILLFRMCKENPTRFYQKLDYELNSRFHGLSLPIAVFTQFMTEVNNLLNAQERLKAEQSHSKPRVIERVVLKNRSNVNTHALIGPKTYSVQGTSL